MLQLLETKRFKTVFQSPCHFSGKASSIDFSELCRRPKKNSFLLNSCSNSLLVIATLFILIVKPCQWFAELRILGRTFCVNVALI